MNNRLKALLEFYPETEDGEVFRCWLFSDSKGHESYRFQRIAPTNCCRVNRQQIHDDYNHLGEWGQGWNNTNTMPEGCYRVSDQRTMLLPLSEEAALRSLSHSASPHLHLEDEEE